MGMRKRFSQNEEGIYTSAEAIVFIGCASIYDLLGEEDWGYSAIVFWDRDVKILTKNDVQSAPYEEEYALYNTIRMALSYCIKIGVKKVDIIYDSDTRLVDSLPISGSSEDIMRGREIIELSNLFINGDARLYMSTLERVDSRRVVDALRRNTDIGWLKQLETEALFLALVRELAWAVVEDPEQVYDLENIICAATDIKQIVIDESFPFEGDEIDTISPKRAKFMDYQRTVLDFIFEIAQSIMKHKMTTHHLLYGYACFCLMTEQEICDELQIEKEACIKVSYVKNKMELLFALDSIKIDPHKLKDIIPLHIEELERDTVAAEDYNLAEKSAFAWKKEKSYADEVIAYAILNKILLDKQVFHPSGMNQVYLSGNKEILLEKGELGELAKKVTRLEEVAGKSKELYEVLTKKIYGQDFAIQKFVQGYVNSKMAGKSRKGKPAASYLFAGPPGVGKTYLAQLASKVLEMPIKIFDMSEYPDDESIYGLVGFDRTWKSSVPGALTTYVNEHPASIILIDEIEKAHRTVQMQFLQILEGARLYDKYYQKNVNFEHTIIIFTTNCGKNLYEHNEDTDLSILSQTEILDSLREDAAFPNELCSRFASGNIIMFNHLQPYYLVDIVRSEMDGVVSDMKDNYGLQITYDEFLPELFLFQAGSGVDARVASSQGAELIKNNVLDFIKDQVEKHNQLAVTRVSIEMKPDKADKDVYSYFVNEEVSNVLVVSESGRFQIKHPGINIMRASNENEMIQIIRENQISCVFIDLTYGAAGGEVIASNALGVDSVGMTCFDVVCEKAPQLPVYIIDQETYCAEDKKNILNHGARGLFSEGRDHTECEDHIRKLLEQLYVQKNLRLLRQKGQRISYKTRYWSKDGCGIIEFYDLSLRAVKVEDAALRRKAQKSKVFDFERPTLRFDDIIGAEQAKRDFRHFINYMHNIEKYVLEGADTPKGVLLYGPPGTGKTSLAKALAGECDALFLNTTGANIRNANNPVQEIQDLFKIAYNNAPAILFIDEIDVIAKERMGYDSGTELLVNTLLTEMEGFNDKDPFKPVFVVAATNYNVEHRTNRPGEVVIDPALVRRFDNPVYVGLPSREERKQYIHLLLKKKNYAEKISEVAIDYVAEHTGGRSLAFLKRAIANMTNRAIDENKEINDDLLTDTLETQLYGEKRENDEKYRLSVARHEAGHAYVAWKTGREPKFITIVSRGNFGGYVSYGDGEDIHNLTKEDFLNCICQSLAGRAAEMVYYGESGINTGAVSDLEHATKYAMRMLCYLGMGDLGLVSLDPEHILDSPKGAELLEEANKILEQQMERAIEFIREGRNAIDHIVDVLMDKSYIQGENLIATLEESEQVVDNPVTTKAKVKKWYVVINGRKPGIYTTWAECLAQVSGYSNAVYRSYTSEEEAKQAFGSSRIGVRNVRDKKLLYHLVKLSELETIVRNGLQPDKQIGGKKYLGFHFHAYSSEAVKEQKANPGENFVYLCISRQRACQMGYQILMEYAPDNREELFEYETGIAQIDWDKMEQIREEDSEQTNVQCVDEKVLDFDKVQFIYTPDERSAKQVSELCPKGVTVSVNKRMFFS